MVSGPTAIQSVPIINFRPDPGEPAARLSASEPQTAGLVSLQEQRNETRLRMRAMAQGEDVLFSNRTFTLGIGNLSPTFQGGLTTVVSRPDMNGFLPDSVAQAQAAEEDPFNTGSDTQEDETDALAPASLEEALKAAEPSEEELEQEKQDLDSEDQRLERNLARARMEISQALESGNPAQVQQAEQKEAQLEREQKENDEELRQIEQERFEQQLKEFQNDAGQAIEENLSAAAGLLGVLLGGNDSENGHSGVPRQTAGNQVPRFSFARSG